MKKTSQRSGFTLVEILIVLGIIAAVASIFIPVVLNMSDRNQVPKAASMLENALSLAKARAVAEKRPNGIRLVATASNLRTMSTGPAFAWFDEVQYIEDPSDFVNGWVWGFSSSGPQTVSQPFWSRAAPIPGELPTGFDAVTVADPIPNFDAMTFSGLQTITSTVPRNRLLFGPIAPDVGGADNNNWRGNSGTLRVTQRMAYNWYAGSPVPVQPGDMVEITGVGELYQIVAVSSDQAPAGPAVNNPNISGNANPIRVPILVLDRPLSCDIAPTLNGRPNFRIIRQPRTIPSLSPMKLPQDVVIDLTPSRAGFPGASNTDTSGAIFMSNVSAGISMTAITGITTTATNLVAPDYIDIMFSPSGEIMPTSQTFRNGTFVGSFSVGQSGLIALWVHQRGDPNLWAARQITAAQGNADNQAIVSINARTGFIGSFPIFLGADPLAIARTGKARMSADTGP